MGSRSPVRAALGLAVAVPALALASCGGGPPPAPPTATAPPPPPAAQPPAAPEPPPPAPIAGLTPLPTPTAVVGGLPQGRIDPFAPVASAASGATDASGRPLPAVKPPLQPPPGFSFSGVVSSRGRAQALVQLAGQTGPICVGTRGFCPGSGIAPLLPAGWSVTRIDVASGLLSLRQGKQSLTLAL